MGAEGRLKQRMEEAVVASYYKPWHSRWWGRVFIVFIFLAIASMIYLGVKVAISVSNINSGKVFNPNSGNWITEETFRENQKELTEIHTGDDPWLGAEEPIIFVVAYESMSCPFCKENQADIRKMIAKFGSLVRFISKDFPTEGLHPNVMDAHLAAACANEQGSYWEYRDILFQNQGEFEKENLRKWAKQLGLSESQFNKCLDEEKYIQEIRADFASGAQAGVVGTPSYIINGNLIPGEIPFDIWEEIIGYILKNNFGQ